jgi:hypothetical protein
VTGGTVASKAEDGRGKAARSGRDPKPPNGTDQDGRWLVVWLRKQSAGVSRSPSAVHPATSCSPRLSEVGAVLADHGFEAQSTETQRRTLASATCELGPLLSPGNALSAWLLCVWGRLWRCGKRNPCRPVLQAARPPCGQTALRAGKRFGLNLDRQAPLGPCAIVDPVAPPLLNRPRTVQRTESGRLVWCRGMFRPWLRSRGGLASGATPRLPAVGVVFSRCRGKPVGAHLRHSGHSGPK